MVFVDRKAKYPGRWTMKKSDGTSEVVTLVRNDEPEVEGTPMNAATLNTLSDVAGADIAKEAAEKAAENAKASQDASARSESAAATSAQNSENSAKRADAKAASAATSEKNAASSASAASKSAAEAKSSQTAAASSATAAAKSASAASESQSAAASSASAAKASQTAAKISETNAAASQKAAASSASSAASSASAAKTSETNAAISEANALRYSQEAGAKANTDKTLSKENAPADAKAVGEALDINKLVNAVDTEETVPTDADYYLCQHVNGDGETDVSYRRKPLSALWNWIKKKLGSAAFKATRTLTSVGPCGWKDAATDQQYVPDMGFMAYWNGAYSGTSSNLAYCNQGAFGSMIKVAARKNHNTSDTWIPVWSGDNLDYILKSELNVKYANGAGNANGFTFGAQSSDPGANSSLTTNKVLFVYE